LDSGVRWKANVSSPVTMESRKSSPSSAFTFCVEKSYDGTHFAFGGTLDRHCHFKHVSLNQSRFYHCQTNAAHRERIKVDGRVAIISLKNIPIGLHVIYLYFPDTLRTLEYVLPKGRQILTELYGVQSYDVLCQCHCQD
jgi:hypothetical protein